MSEFGTTDKNLAPLVQVAKLLEELRYGKAKMEFKVHEGKIIAIVGSNVRNVHYKDDGAVECVTETVQMIKDARDGGHTGTISAHFELKEGKIKRLTIETNTVKKYEF